MDKRNYPDPQQHLARHIDQAAERYVQAMDTCGLQPNERLARAIVEQTVKKAEASYRQETDAVLEHNISIVEQQYRERDNKIKREGAKMRLWTCPPIAVWFGFLSWLCFNQSSVMMGWIYAVASLAFLGMLVYGWIFDSPEKEAR